MTPEAIEKRWENGYQIRAAGGWIKVAGQPDPRHDVRALLSENARLRGQLHDIAKPKPKPKRKKRIATSTAPAMGEAAIDTRKVDED